MPALKRLGLHAEEDVMDSVIVWHQFEVENFARIGCLHCNPHNFQKCKSSSNDGFGFLRGYPNFVRVHTMEELIYPQSSTLGQP